jgi:hypothetical protein
MNTVPSYASWDAEYKHFHPQTLRNDPSWDQVSMHLDALRVLWRVPLRNNETFYPDRVRNCLLPPMLCVFYIFRPVV